MKHFAIAFALAVPLAASAAGYPPLSLSDSGDTCYTWEGGRGSAGSFTKCSPQVSVASAPKALPPPVLPSPVMMPQSAPISCAPPPKPVFKKKHKPPVKC